MLTKLANGNAVDLSKATKIEAADASSEFASIKPRVLIKWLFAGRSSLEPAVYEVEIIECDTFDAACAERDRLIEIANRQSSKTSKAVCIKGEWRRASDVVSAAAMIAAYEPYTRREVCVHVKKSSGDGTYPIGVMFDSEAEAASYAREIMEQVAGAE